MVKKQKRKRVALTTHEVREAAAIILESHVRESGELRMKFTELVKYIEEDVAVPDGKKSLRSDLIFVTLIQPRESMFDWRRETQEIAFTAKATREIFGSQKIAKAMAA